jgi:hypothetical protein
MVQCADNVITIGTLAADVSDTCFIDITRRKEEGLIFTLHIRCISALAC